MLVLAVDPGGTTGYAAATVDDGVIDFEYALQLGTHEFDRFVHWLASEWGPDLTIVCERFTISERTLRASKGGSYDAIERIGVLRYLSLEYCGRDLAMQQPADVMRLFDNTRLKLMSWYQPGKDHANDACRHLAYFLALNHRLHIPTTNSEPA